MATAPRITVITATYNGAESLRSTLASLCAQEWTDFEAWIVGDASTDDSASVVASFCDDRLRWANLSRNTGSQSAANNEGLRRARGQHVAFLGHDDLWFPWHLGGLVGALEADGADVAHSLVVMLDPAGVVGVIGEPPHGVPYAHHFFPPSSWLHRRDVVECVGEWTAPDDAVCAVDEEFIRRMAAAGLRFAFAPRLSVLKLPSGRFRAYAPDAIRPQAAYLARMQDDAVGLEHAMLTDIARLLARDQAPAGLQPGSAAAYLRRALRTLVRRRVLDRFGEGWPLRAVARWRFQRHRRQMRATRGLPPG